MKSRSNLHLLAIGPMVWVELAVLFSLAFVAPRGVFVLGADLTASAEATRLVVTLVRSPTVQKELKFDARQAAAVNAAVAEIDEPLWRLRDASAERSAADVHALRNKFEAELRAALRPEQQQRVEQLLWRAQGVWALEGRPPRRSAGS